MVGRKPRWEKEESLSSSRLVVLSPTVLGEPIPIIHWEDNLTTRRFLKIKLPLRLPKTDNIKPSGTGESPLANVTDWVNVTDPETGKKDVVKPIRCRNGLEAHGISCALSILIISLFWQTTTNWNAGCQSIFISVAQSTLSCTCFMLASGINSCMISVSCQRKEPFEKLFNQGMILGKTMKNVEIPWQRRQSRWCHQSIRSDTLRLYEMFMGPLDASIAWNENGLEGSRKFLDRVWRLIVDENGKMRDRITTFNDGKLSKVYHQTVKKVTKILSSCTSIRRFPNWWSLSMKRTKPMPCREYVEGFVQLAPITAYREELCRSGNDHGISYVPWPTYDESALVEGEIESRLSSQRQSSRQSNGASGCRKAVLEQLAQENELVQNSSRKNDP